MVISRSGDHPRKRLVHAALDRLGLPHEFLDATMGEDLSKEKLAEIYDEQAARAHKTISRTLHPSHIGCSYSHKRAYALVAARPLPGAVLLEDDALPLPDIDARALERAVGELPRDWDLLYLGFRGHHRAPWFFSLKRYCFLPWARLLFPGKYRLTFQETGRLYLRPFSAHLDRAGYHQGTHAYAVSNQGAQRILGQTGKVDAPADVILATLVIEGKLNAFALRKEIFTTSGAASQIVSTL